MPDGNLGQSVLSHVIVLGAVSGMRSMLGLALLAWFGGPGVGLLSALWARVVVGLAAAFEIVNDKLPRTPSRLIPPQFAARLLLGAICGALLMRRAHLILWIGVGLGALSAAGAAVVASKVRRFLGQKTGLADPWFGALEDLVAIALGFWAVG